MNERILIVDDEEIVRTNIAEFLESQGYVMGRAADGRIALEQLLAEDFALVITDIRMPNMNGIELLKRIVNERPETSVLLMTAYASVETAIESLRLGAYDYLLKPIVFEDLLQRIQNLFTYRHLKEEVGRLRRDLRGRLGFEGIVGSSPAIRETFELIERVAPTATTVLVVGESGTGKELVSRAIHQHSNCADMEFLAVNMAAMPRDMVEAQLFGHEKGAFTGADRRRDGLLRSVRGGTIFLDEVGEVPLSAQVKLLRAVEEQEVLPVGADRPVSVDFRLVAATNRDLEAAVREGTFRQDLYYRLNVFQIRVPPLAERRDDISALVDHFVALHCRALGKERPTVSNETMKLLLAYSWPGNVRELSNVLERACILCANVRIDVSHLPSEILDGEMLPTSLKHAVETFERSHIAWVLRAANGNREQAAKVLEIDPATLYRRLAKYDIEEMK
ncbi:MAG: sigma-54-dependent Fis family transcriptional regulator [Deltaproteobacteria bacterium]|nr:sigma-54-dependent Fis family transcriptional regulator [Deltaproteobacteria bacterium]